LTVTPVNFMHNRLQVFGFRMEDFAYLTDLKSIEDNEVEKLRDLKVLVVSALRVEPHHSHFNLEEALEFIKIVKPETAYLTHISHMLGFHDEVEKQLPPNVHLAFDNLKITV
ncbi:MAG: MBL fold metallo-hydrolase, partial [Gramella sp.]|nr:MBL fold metallo-hydrolase [Christiangramia sp.]